MGDSACLMQPFSYTAGIPNEANEVCSLSFTIHLSTFFVLFV